MCGVSKYPRSLSVYLWKPPVVRRTASTVSTQWVGSSVHTLGCRCGRGYGPGPPEEVQRSTDRFPERVVPELNVKDLGIRPTQREVPHQLAYSSQYLVFNTTEVDTRVFQDFVVAEERLFRVRRSTSPTSQCPSPDPQHSVSRR